MAVKFCDLSEIRGLQAVLTPPAQWGLLVALYTNDNSGDPTLDCSQFFDTGVEGFNAKGLVFPAPDTDDASRASAFSDPVTFILGENIPAGLDVYGFYFFFSDGLGTKILVGWEYFPAPYAFNLAGQSLTITVKAYCKDAEGVPA